MAKKTTPMMKQYEEIKANYSDCILFFRLGDFYEMFNDDAKEASKILDITLTARGKGEDAIPMCGVPHHSAEGYILKLTHAGKKVALAEQTSDPSLPGIVTRDVVRVITPGTNLSDTYLAERIHSRILSLVADGETVYFSYADVSTGNVCFGSTARTGLHTLFQQVDPVELVAKNELLEAPDVYSVSLQYDLLKTAVNTPRRATEYIKEQLNVSTLAGFDLDEDKDSQLIASLAMLYRYITDTQKSQSVQLQNLRRIGNNKTMVLDAITIQNLELFRTQRDGRRQGSFFSTINHCVTAAGTRLLAEWVLRPLADKNKIEERQKLINILCTNGALRLSLITLLKETVDVSRLTQKIAFNHGTPRILAAIRETLRLLPKLQELLSAADEFVTLQSGVAPITELQDLLENALAENPPAFINDLGIIKDGYDAEIDRLRQLYNNSNELLDSFLKTEQEKTGIQNLKIGFNKIAGFYLEVSKGKLDLVPDSYTPKQTLTNCTRFITPELKQFEQDHLNAKHQLEQREAHLCRTLFEQTLAFSEALQRTGLTLAQLDCLSGLAELAIRNSYNKPVIAADRTLEIKQGRHPVVECLINQGSFTANDLSLSDKEHCVVLTGPNMGGKSTYLRQTALITLLAHIGSFIPAQEATIPLTDRIFTRIGASDNLTKGQSTFMVEMQELALILNQATEHSLLIIDEIGRGTATHDGISIARAALEYIHNTVKGHTLFATHYHELIDVANGLAGATNYCMSVHDSGGSIVFTHSVVKGGMSDSYGLEVAKIAGVPKAVLQIAQTYLDSFKSDSDSSSGSKPANNIDSDQLSIFAVDQTPRSHKQVVSRLEELDPNKLTPLEALTTLADLKADLADE
jgi:DNA mismatch repair protein MutS